MMDADYPNTGPGTYGKPSSKFIKLQAFMLEFEGRRSGLNPLTQASGYILRCKGSPTDSEAPYQLQAPNFEEAALLKPHHVLQLLSWLQAAKMARCFFFVSAITQSGIKLQLQIWLHSQVIGLLFYPEQTMAYLPSDDVLNNAQLSELIKAFNTTYRQNCAHTIAEPLPIPSQLLPLARRTIGACADDAAHLLSFPDRAARINPDRYEGYVASDGSLYAVSLTTGLVFDNEADGAAARIVVECRSPRASAILASIATLRMKIGRRVYIVCQNDLSVRRASCCVESALYERGGVPVIQQRYESKTVVPDAIAPKCVEIIILHQVHMNAILRAEVVPGEVWILPGVDVDSALLARVCEKHPLLVHGCEEARAAEWMSDYHPSTTLLTCLPDRGEQGPQFGEYTSRALLWVQFILASLARAKDHDAAQILVDAAWLLESDPRAAILSLPDDICEEFLSQLPLQEPDFHDLPQPCTADNVAGWLEYKFMSCDIVIKLALWQMERPAVPCLVKCPPTLHPMLLQAGFEFHKDRSKALIPADQQIDECVMNRFSRVGIVGSQGSLGRQDHLFELVYAWNFRPDINVKFFYLRDGLTQFSAEYKNEEVDLVTVEEWCKIFEGSLRAGSNLTDLLSKIAVGTYVDENSQADTSL